MDPGGRAALLETFSRRCTGDHFPREDEPLKVGKGKMLHAIRVTYGKCEYRLIYVQVKHPTSSPRNTTAVVVKVDSTPIQFVGLLAWVKKRSNVGTARGGIAWQRSELWLDEHEDYVRN
jgi:hypothetical protein